MDVIKKYNVIVDCGHNCIVINNETVEQTLRTRDRDEPIGRREGTRMEEHNVNTQEVIVDVIILLNQLD